MLPVMQQDVSLIQSDRISCPGSHVGARTFVWRRDGSYSLTKMIHCEPPHGTILIVLVVKRSLDS